MTWLASRFLRAVPGPMAYHLITIFLLLLFLVLAIDGVHEASEARVIPGTEALHWATEAYSTEGIYGRFAPYSLVAVPLAWWLLALFWGYGKASDGRVAHLER
jgi:hypothetical protein